ncbi:MAG TPA: Inner spore coat protein H, partial [Cystobacter sp.]
MPESPPAQSEVGGGQVPTPPGPEVPRGEPPPQPVPPPKDPPKQPPPDSQTPSRPSPAEPRWPALQTSIPVYELTLSQADY